MIRKNLFLNAQLVANGTPMYRSIDTESYDYSLTNGMRVTSTLSNGSFTEWRLTGFETGIEYAIRLDLNYPSTIDSRSFGQVVSMAKMDDYIFFHIMLPQHPYQGELEGRFIAPDSTLKFQLRGCQRYANNPNEPAYTDFANIQIERADTYDNRGNSPVFFHGDLYPRT